MEKRVSDLDMVIQKLVKQHETAFSQRPTKEDCETQKKQFQKMNMVVDRIESLAFEAHKTNGWKFVQEPLWVTWSLEKFGT